MRINLQLQTSDFVDCRFAVAMAVITAQISRAKSTIYKVRGLQLYVDTHK